MRLAVLGGGGFRTPHVWESVARVAGDLVDELALYDASQRRLARIAAVISGLSQERGGGPAVATTTSLAGALEGAHVVFCAIRVGGLEGRVVDETVPLREGVLGQETVGPGGISFALRTVPVMLDLARRVTEVAPSSWFVNFTNPAGLVTEALRNVLGDRVIGICDSPEALCAGVAAALGRRRRELDFDYAGLNHLGWLLAARDEGGRDLLADLLGDDDKLAGLEQARLFGAERLREIGMIPNEYLVYYERPGEVVGALRRAEATRAQVLAAQQARFYAPTGEGPAEALASWRRTKNDRYGTYMAEAWDAVVRADQRRNEPAPGAEHRLQPARNSAGEGPAEAGYAAVAAALLRALADGSRDTVILNVPNRGRLDFLDDTAVVEVPCDVTPQGPHTRAVGRLPPEQAELVARVKEVERTTIRAAIEGSRALALEALVAHPVVPTRMVAERILEGYTAACPELAERLK